METSYRKHMHQTGFSSTLRALGLQILDQIPFFWTSKRKLGHVEAPKPVVRTSLYTSLALATVHILPVMVSITVLGLNLGHLWLGITLPGSLTDNDLMSAIFQVFAKVQELLIAASLTAAVYHIILHHLIAAEGVPFGFLFAPFSFSELSYFWSSEFWGALNGRISRFSKVSMAATVLAAGLIAAFAGPSVAVLLIPRQQDWYAGGTEFYLRAKEADIFPSNLSVSHLPAKCLGSEAYDYAICPSGGFKHLSLYTSSLQTIRNDENMVPVPKGSKGQWGSYGLFQQQLVSIPGIHLDTQLLPMSTISGSIRGIVCQTEAVAPFLPISLYSSCLSNDWESIAATAQFNVNNPSLAEYRWRDSKTVAAKGKIPAVRTSCSAAQNLSTTARAVNFPVLPQAGCPEGELPVSLPRLNNTPSSSLRVSWIHDLPDELGIVVGCSIDGRWTEGEVRNNQAYPSIIASTEDWKIVAGYIAPMFMPPNNKSWVRIRLDDVWTQVADAQGTGPGSLQSLLAESAIIDANITMAADQTTTWNNAVQGSANRTLLLEWLTSLAVVDSLSRYGAYRFLNTTGPPYDWALLDYHRRTDFSEKLLRGKPALEKPAASEIPSFTTYRLSIVLNGLLYRASSVTDYLAMAILVGHMLIALGHTVYLILYRRSSTSWDTIAEFVALAHNSTPSKRALKNASAGIRTKRAFSQVAQVKAITRLPEISDEKSVHTSVPVTLASSLPTQHAELIFVESDDESIDDDDDEENRGMITDIATENIPAAPTLEGSSSEMLPLSSPGVVSTLTWPLPWIRTSAAQNRSGTTAHIRNISTNSGNPLLETSTPSGILKRSPYSRIEPDQLYS